MPTEAILSTARQFLEVDPTVSITLEPIKKGASGRTIVRVKSPVREPFIGIHWTDEREDNDFFLPVAKLLRSLKFRVPAILFEKQRYRVALVEDLGDADLLSIKDRPFEDRLPWYSSALEQVDRLFYAKIPKDFPFMPSFDARMYRWEQEYFFEHVVEDFLSGDASRLRADPVLARMAEKLGTAAKHVVHRDFQSQNVMLHCDEAWMIDFQGMRRGRQEYDLASLIYDPYLNHTAEERDALLDLWEEISEERPEPGLYRQCAAQRLMQAMGAYGNILKRTGDSWYRPHLSTAARQLEQVIRGSELEASLAPVLETIS
jgi:N-acetylmuramate 1-kinase